MAYLFGWKPANIREEVLYQRLRSVGVNTQDLDRRFHAKGYEDGFRELVEKHDILVDIAVNAVDAVIANSDNLTYAGRRKRVIVGVCRQFSKHVSYLQRDSCDN